jgi:hypothetical protein
MSELRTRDVVDADLPAVLSIRNRSFGPLGVVLVILGIFGFLPILGFWMIPLGLLVLSYEFATVRRWRRKLEVSWGRWRNGRA